MDLEIEAVLQKEERFGTLAEIFAAINAFSAKGPRECADQRLSQLHPKNKH